MLIRMTEMGTTLASLLAAGTLAAGGLLAPDPSGPGGSPPRTALVIDASLARDGRDLVGPRLRDRAGELRLPRTAAEARTNVRYFSKLGYRVTVVGPLARTAARATGVAVSR
jgi:hypothetical protein